MVWSLEYTIQYTNAPMLDLSVVITMVELLREGKGREEKGVTTPLVWKIKVSQNLQFGGTPKNNYRIIFERSLQFS